MRESPPITQEARPAPAAWRQWRGRLAGIAFGVLMAWLLLEVLLRVMFFSLPPRLQLVLHEVRVTPFSDRKLMPDPIWQSDIDYLTIARPVQNYEQFGSAEVRYTVNTATLWNQRGAFRTSQNQVDRYVDAVAVGDSFTFCFTDESACWVQQLSALTNRNVINLGIVSTGSVSHLRVLENFGMPLQPPLVIWQWFGNDANEDFGLAQLRGETDLTSTHEAPPTPKRNWWDDHSAVYVLLKLYLGNEDDFQASLQFLDSEFVTEGDITLGFGQPYLWEAFDMAEPANQYGWERTQDAIRSAQTQIESYGGHLLILLMPTKEQVYREMSEPALGTDKLALLDASSDLMRDFCAEEELTCLDLLPVFRPYAEAGEQIYYRTDMHLNPAGNDVLTEALAAWLDAHPEVFKKTNDAS